MGHYDDVFGKLEREVKKEEKRKLLGIIDRASADDIRFLYKVASNLQGYKNFEKFVKNIITEGKKI